MMDIFDRLMEDLRPLRFGPPVTCIYNPLEYARPPFELYLQRYGQAPKEVILLGMNPGPFGMAQTGIPFGEVSHVRDWLGLQAPIGRPDTEHPKRPIQGFECSRSEVSGARVWGWARARFSDPETFFRRFLVLNYCPLVFMEESGRNRTPDRLPLAERRPLFEACDRALRQQVEHLRPRFLLAVGRFAEKRAQEALRGLEVGIGSVPHPSPANPGANRGWDRLMDRALLELGLNLP
ncbi:MAG: uracil-DNA glycosylase family protein [Candidatus Xenobium sp.]|jgi:single-strand selective monofunctional uracil DNA glycosylase|nr:single-stranded DNA-binding protein [Burkholderiales bacterium]